MVIIIIEGNNKKTKKGKTNLRRFQMKDEFERGLEKGVELGEMNEKVRIARKLLKIGIKVEQVREITGLKSKDIIEIKNDLTKYN